MFFCFCVLFSSNLNVGVLSTPFFMEIEKSGFKGPIYDMVIEIAEIEDWTLHFISVDDDRLFQMLKEEKIDFIIPVSRSWELEGDSVFDYNKYDFIPVTNKGDGLFALFNSRSSRKFDVMMALDNHLSTWKKDYDSDYYKILSKYMYLSPQKNENFKIGVYLVILVALLAFIISSAASKYLKHLQVKKNHAKFSVLETQNQQIMHKTSEMIELISVLGTEKLEENIFLNKLLSLAISIIPEASYGSIIMGTQGSNWNFVCAKGHRIESLKMINMDKNYLFPIRGPVVMDSISNIFFERMPLEFARRIYKSMLPVKSTAIVPLRSIGIITGYMLVDISQKSQSAFSDSSVNILKSLAPLASSFLDFRRMEKKHHEFQESIVRSLVKLLELRDAYTSGHSGRVAFYARKIGERMGLETRVLDNIYWAGLLHDIGKVLIDRGVLNKPSKLSEEEFELIKQHPVVGSQVLRESAEYAPLSHIVLYHHESRNGKGYPEGLRGEEIPLESRIISVADTYDAMTTDRPYRNAMPPEAALNEILKMSGIQFDPHVVNCFSHVYDSLEEWGVGNAI